MLGAAAHRLQTSPVWITALSSRGTVEPLVRSLEMKTAFIAMLVLIGSVSVAETAQDAARTAAAHAASTAVGNVAPATAPVAPPVSNESKKNVCDTPTSESRSAVGSPASIY